MNNDPLNPQQSPNTDNPVLEPAPDTNPVITPYGQPAAPENQPVTAAPNMAPSKTPVAQPMPQPISSPPKSHKKLILIVVLVFVVITVLGFIAGLFFSTLNSLTLKLTTYETENYSIQIPEEYKKTENGSEVLFEENDTNEDTQSSIIVVEGSFEGQTVTEEDKVTYLNTVVEMLTKNSTVFGPDNDFKDTVVTDINPEGNIGKKITGSVYKDDIQVGTAQIVVIVSDEAYYMVGVAAHKDDNSLERKTDEIINSFDIK